MGNPICINSVPPSHTGWPWFSPKLVVNWKSFIGFVGLWTKYLTQQLKSWFGLCKKAGRNICQREERLQAQFYFVFLYLEQVLKTKKPTQCSWEGCGRGKDVCCIAAQGKVATACWASGLAVVLTLGSAVIHTSVWFAQKYCLRWKKSVGAQLRRLSEHEITEAKGVPLPTELGIGVAERADLAPAAVMGFNGIICAHVLPASGWFQPGSWSCCVAEHRSVTLCLEAFLRSSCPSLSCLFTPGLNSGIWWPMGFGEVCRVAVKLWNQLHYFKDRCYSSLFCRYEQFG